MEVYEQELHASVKELRKKYDAEFRKWTNLPLSQFWNPREGLDIQAVKSWLALEPTVTDRELWRLLARTHGWEFTLLMVNIAIDSMVLLIDYMETRLAKLSRELDELQGEKIRSKSD